MGRFKLLTTSFEEGLNSLKNGPVKKLYFLMGADHYLQKYFIDNIYDIVSSNNTVQKVFLMPDDMTGKDIIDRLTTMDLFNSMNLFILRSPNTIKGKVRDELVNYCHNPTQQNILILIQDEYGAKNKMIQNLTSLVKPISVSTPFASKMENWVKLFFKNNGLNQVPKEVIEYIIETSGDSLNHLKNEIDKISINLDVNDKLDRKYVDQYSIWRRKFKEYEFFNLLGERKLRKTLEFGRMLVSQETSLINLLYPMTEFFQELLFLKISRGTNSNSKRYTSLAQSVNRKIPSYASNYSSKEIISALKRLGQIDRKIKTTTINDESIITEFLYATVNNG